MFTLRKSLTTIGLATVLALGVASAAQASIDDDGVYAETTGAKVTGTVYWQDFAGHVYYELTVTDTRVDGACANLYVRQRNAAGASSGWRYIGHACGGGTAWRFTGNNRPFQGGTSGFDVAVLRSEYGNYATDINAIMGA